MRSNYKVRFLNIKRSLLAFSRPQRFPSEVLILTSSLCKFLLTYNMHRQTKNTVLDLWISLMYRKNKSSPSIEPWGTT